MVGLGLFRPLRVGPERASKANKISLSGGNNLFSKVRGSNRAGGYNWDGDRLLYLSGRPGVVAVAHCHRRGLMNHSVVVTAGDVECIDALVFQHFSQRYCLLNREAVRFIVCAAQADGNRKVRADLFAHIAGYLHVDAHAVFKRAAVEVGAVVRGG